jgi:GNAT superfamily N-acetyltransferase
MIRVRDALRQDIPELLRLMRALARFEGYAEAFAVTARDLEERGFGAQPQFRALLATEGELGRSIGMAVYYLVPFTFDLRPTLVLKELYVEEEWRARGAGELLMRAVARDALRLGCGRMRWDVLNGNAAAERFYQRLGGRREEYWVAYRMDAEEIGALAEERD